MKTMKKNGSIIRVAEKDVNEKLMLDYFFTSKKEWKDNVRVVRNTKKVVDETEQTKTNK